MQQRAQNVATIISIQVCQLGEKKKKNQKVRDCNAERTRKRMEQGKTSISSRAASAARSRD
jgi:hypothetical protein